MKFKFIALALSMLTITSSVFGVLDCSKCRVIGGECSTMSAIAGAAQECKDNCQVYRPGTPNARCIKKGTMGATGPTA
jgi:hypothetical protein